jgi:hypothetical protein
MHPRPWHRGSVFGDGRRVPLDRNQRARFRFLLSAHRRARRLTRAALDVGLALLKRLGEDGRLDPSQATLAKDADCSDRTVRTVLAALRGFGLLRWDRRLVRTEWRAEQTSNQYELITTAEVLETGSKSAPVSCGGSFRRETPLVLIQDKPAHEVRAAQRALARVREMMERRLAGDHPRGGWSAR